MKLSIAKFYQAHYSNYTVGRNLPIRKFTVHHSAGWEATLRHLWADPARNGSSTFWVGNVLGAIEQYLDTKDTPWTNGNFTSNSESLTCETRGDWRGYYDAITLKNLENLMYECLKIWPHLVLEFHMDVSRTATLCPADLKHKGHALAAWNRAKARIAAKPAPTPAPVPSAIKYIPVGPKRVQLKKISNLWNFNFTSWANAKAVNSAEFPNGYPAGYNVDVVAQATNTLGAKYYLTAYSAGTSDPLVIKRADFKPRFTYGFNVADAPDYIPAPIPQPQPGPIPPVNPPAVIPIWEPMATPREMEAAIDLYVINLDTKEKQGDLIPAGKPIEFVEKINTDKMYLRSKWAKINNKNWGIPFDQLKEVADPVNEPIPEKPLDVDPTVPGDGDIEKRLSVIETFLDSIFSAWRK